MDAIRRLLGEDDSAEESREVQFGRELAELSKQINANRSNPQVVAQLTAKIREISMQLVNMHKAKPQMGVSMTGQTYTGTTAGEHNRFPKGRWT